MSNIRVTYGDMNDAASKLRAGMDELQHKLDELSSYIDSLVHDGFVTDQASNAFQNTYHNFTSGAKQTVGAIDDLSGYLDHAAQTLSDTDTGLAQSISS